MFSMTGFGSASYKGKSLTLDISVKSVNGRYLDLKIYGPRIYQSIENEIKEVAREFLQRGSVEISVNRRSAGESENVSFNVGLAEKWLKGFKKLTQRLDVKGDLTPDFLLQIPDLYKIEESESAVRGEKEPVLSTLKKALKACVAERSREGGKLKQSLMAHISELGKCIDQINKLRQQSQEEMKSRYLQKLKKLEVPGDIDESRMVQEVVLLTERTDIAEEIKRLEAHLSAIKKLFSDKEPIGKRLDFFAQELLREVNTIGSKSYSAPLTSAVVKAKDFVEKFREQVQNIE